MPPEHPIVLPTVDESTGRGQRIRQTEKRFGMTCIDTMGRQSPHVLELKMRNAPVSMDVYAQQFGNQGKD